MDASSVGLPKRQRVHPMLAKIIIYNNSLVDWLSAIGVAFIISAAALFARRVSRQKHSILAGSTITAWDDLLAEPVGRLNGFFFLTAAGHLGSIRLSLPHPPRRASVMPWLSLCIVKSPRRALNSPPRPRPCLLNGNRELSTVSRGEESVGRGGGIRLAGVVRSLPSIEMTESGRGDRERSGYPAARPRNNFT